MSCSDLHLDKRLSLAIPVTRSKFASNENISKRGAEASKGNPYLHVVGRVCLEHIVQGELPWPLPLLVVDVAWVRPVQIAHNLCVLRRLWLIHQGLEDTCAQIEESPPEKIDASTMCPPRQVNKMCISTSE